MFQYIGEGEQGGSGYPTIVNAWRDQHWRIPLLGVEPAIERSTLEMSFASLLSADVVAALQSRFGTAFDALSPQGRAAVAAALRETRVTNERLRVLADMHPADATLLLRELVRSGFLEKNGDRRAAFYTLSSFVPGSGGAAAWHPTASTEAEAGGGDAISSTHEGDSNSPHTFQSSTHKHSSSTHNGDTDSARNAQSSAHHTATYAGGEPAPISADHVAEIHAAVAAVRRSSRARPEMVEEAILALCQSTFYSAAELGEILNRNPQGLTERFLSPLVVSGRLELRNPAKPTDPRQGYRAVR